MIDTLVFNELTNDELMMVDGGSPWSVAKDVVSTTGKAFKEFGKTLVSDEFRKPFTSVVKMTVASCSLIVNPLGFERAAYTIQDEWHKLSSYAN